MGGGSARNRGGLFNRPVEVSLPSMPSLSLHEFHSRLGASFGDLGGQEAVLDYGQPDVERGWLRGSAGVLDLGFRGRICLTGADRVRLLHGQVTNDVEGLKTGSGCYAALVTARGKLQSDLHVYALENELLLDFEPGLTRVLQERFEHYIVADDVQVVDVAPYYGLLSVQGPRAAAVVARLDLGVEWPEADHAFQQVSPAGLGDLYLVRHGRAGGMGGDLFVPVDALGMVWDRLVAAARAEGGGPAGWTALDRARLEAGIPRFGVDLDETSLAPEGGDAFVQRAISYRKGCYIGQEVIARIRTYGQVTRALRGLRVESPGDVVPRRGDPLFHEGRPVGMVTSAVRSDWLGGVVALGLVRRECNQPGQALELRMAEGTARATIVPLPFTAAPA